MEFWWEALTLRGAGGRIEPRMVRTAGAVEVAMTPYGGIDRPRYVVEVHRTRDGAEDPSAGSQSAPRLGDGPRTVRTVGTTNDFSTGLAMVVDAVLSVECDSTASEP